MAEVAEVTETTGKRNRRSQEERIAELDAKIKSHEETIEKLKAKKEAILNPKPRASKAAKTKALIAKAKEAGFTDEEIDALLEKAISRKVAKAQA